MSVPSQRPSGRLAPGLAKPDHAYSISCPHCLKLVPLAVEDEPVTNGEVRRCAVCGKPIIGRRSQAVYCSDNCNARAYRRRKRGVPQNAFPHGGGRGSLRLNERSHAEVLADLALAAEEH